MKKAVFLFIFVLLARIVVGQTLEIGHRQVLLGSAGSQTAYAVIPVSDGFVWACSSGAPDGLVKYNYGGTDVWLVKTNFQGDTLWTKIMGGTGNDYVIDLVENNTGGFMLLAETNSTDHWVNNQHGSYDVWLLNLDSNGDTIWTRTIGSANEERAFNILKGPSNYHVFARTEGVGGDITLALGFNDYWLGKIDEQGNIIDEDVYGGSTTDNAGFMHKVSDDRLFLYGGSFSSDGHMTGYYGQGDFLGVLIDTSGNVIWSKNYGGSGEDDFFMATYRSKLANRPLGLGRAASDDIDLAGYAAGYKTWFIKPDIANGSITDHVVPDGSSWRQLWWNDYFLYEKSDVIYVMDTSFNMLDTLNIIGLSTIYYFYAYSDTSIMVVGDSTTMSMSKEPMFIELKVADPCGLSVNVSVDSIACNGDSDAAITLTPSGSPPFSYNWSTGATDSSISSLSPGWYYYTVQDATCSDSDSVFIAEPPLLEIDSISSFPILCYGDSTSAHAFVTGGVPPYDYGWNHGETGASAILISGNYAVTVLDFNGCIAVDSIELLEPTQLTIDSMVADTMYCGGVDSVSVYTMATGGTGSLSFSWNSGQFTDSISVVSAQQYIVTVTDLNACSVTDSILVKSVDQPIIDSIVTSQDSGLYHAEVFAQNGDIFWLNGFGGQLDSFFTNIDTGWAQFKVYNGLCVDSDSVYLADYPIYGVWPGDVNSNGIANFQDLLPIGIAYGSTGPVRGVTGIMWQEYYSSDWSSTFVNGVDYKHADCDGDGSVNSADALAIRTNYGETHSKKGASFKGTSVDPPLWFESAVDTIAPGDDIGVEIKLGDLSTQATGVYGVAFSLEYGQGWVDSISYSMSSSWMGVSTVDLIEIVHNNQSGNQVEIALTRIDHTEMDGSGTIISLNVHTADSFTTTPTHIGFQLGDVSIISSAEDTVPIFVDTTDNTGDVIIVSNYHSKIQNEGLLSFYPNPSDEKIQVENWKRWDYIEITNLQGSIVQKTKSKSQIDLRDIQPGSYVIHAYSESETSSQKLIIN